MLNLILSVCSYCKAKGHSIDQCFSLKGSYPDWYINLKSKGGGGPSKLAAHVSGVSSGVHVEDHPLAGGSDYSHSSASKPDPQMLNAVCQELMKMLKGKDVQSSSSTSLIPNNNVCTCCVSCYCM